MISGPRLFPQFASYTPSVDMIPAVGVDNILAMANQALGNGGCDCVLLAPELVRDNGPHGLVARLKMQGHR